MTLNALDWPLFLFRFLFHLLLQVHSQHSPTGQGDLESSCWIYCRPLNVYLYPFKTAQISSTDHSFHFAFFTYWCRWTSDISNHQAHMGTLFGVGYMRVNVYSYPFRMAPIPLTGRSFCISLFVTYSCTRTFTTCKFL
jgi:hypothetical protein